MSVHLDLENKSKVPPSPTVSSPGSSHFRKTVENLSPVLTKASNILSVVNQTAVETSQYVSNALPMLSSQQTTPSLLPRVQASERPSNVGKRKFQEVEDVPQTETSSKTLETRAPLKKQFPALFELISIAKKSKKALCFHEIKEYLKDTTEEVEYKISLFLFTLSKIKPLVAKMLRQALSKEGMNSISLTKEEVISLRSFDLYRGKLAQLIDKRYFHKLTWQSRFLPWEMQADFEKIDAHTRFFEKIENE
ncbi:MAG TPA: hypothetical protein VLG76_05095 [Rhabdochlamydiaceae bacterium]|nr:hypothetical protein [Rhabdochlamydiaceae bacterium]